MKSLNLAVIVSSAILLVSGAVHAEDQYKKDAHNQNFMSKRPYHQALPDSAYQKTGEWEGATLVQGDANTDASALESNKALRMNQLSKRPY